MTEILSNQEYLRRAQTLAFSILALSQLMYATTMRDHEVSVFGSKLYQNRLMVFAILFGIGAQVLVTEVPFFTQAFHTSPLSVQDWGIVIAVSLMPVAVHEIQVIVRKIFRNS